jgi:Zn-dependent protease
MWISRGTIPIAIHPIFWFFAALIGWLQSASFLGTVIWIFVILVSVLVHELGHAFTAHLFGQKAQIQLVALGGVTSYQGDRLSLVKQFLIVLNGPLFGLMLAGVAYALLRASTAPPSLVGAILVIFGVANVFWSLLNLLPILPLDGGQLLRIILQAIWGTRGVKAVYVVSAILAVVLGGLLIYVGWLFAGFFCFVFSYQNIQSWRAYRFASPADEQAGMREELLKAELAIEQGRYEEALALLKGIEERGDGGLFAFAALQRHAWVLVQQGQRKEAFDLLRPWTTRLSDEMKGLFHQLAYEQKEDRLVLELATVCDRLYPGFETAMRNARASARLGNVEAARGWLLRASEYQPLDFTTVLLEEDFAKVKDRLHV